MPVFGGDQLTEEEKAMGFTADDDWGSDDGWGDDSGWGDDDIEDEEFDFDKEFPEFQI